VINTGRGYELLVIDAVILIPRETGCGFQRHLEVGRQFDRQWKNDTALDCVVLEMVGAGWKSDVRQERERGLAGRDLIPACIRPVSG
jgi:hypothetical protein